MYKDVNHYAEMLKLVSCAINTQESIIEMNFIRPPNLLYTISERWI